MADDQPRGKNQPAEDQPADAGPQPQDPWQGRETSEFPSTGDGTAILPAAGPGQTAPLPPAGGAGEQPPRWTARAGVPAQAPRGAIPQEQEEWVPERESRSWWLPVLITLAVLILLGLIGLGIWMALHSSSGPAPAASNSPGTSPSPSPASPTPSPSPASSAPLVEVPDVRGETVSDAKDTLGGVGLKVKVQTQVTNAQPPGTVLSTQPTAGSKVRAGTEVTLVVAQAPSPSPSASPSRSSPSPTP